MRELRRLIFGILPVDIIDSFGVLKECYFALCMILINSGFSLKAVVKTFKIDS